MKLARIYEDAKYQPSISSFLQYSKAVSLTQFVKIVRMCLQTFFCQKFECLFKLTSDFMIKHHDDVETLTTQNITFVFAVKKVVFMAVHA